MNKLLMLKEKKLEETIHVLAEVVKNIKNVVEKINKFLKNMFTVENITILGNV